MAKTPFVTLVFQGTRFGNVRCPWRPSPSSQAAFEHHTRAMRLASAGTWGVTASECRTQELKTYPDP